MAQPRRALVIIDVQNEFLSPEGNFPCPEASTMPLVRNLTTLIPKFREAGGLIFWVRAIYEDRSEEPAAMKDSTPGSDKWLTNATHVYEVSCCKKYTFGSEIQGDIWACADLKDGQPANNDSLVTKGFYSAFTGTKELQTLLEDKRVTDAYFCGVASNTCVLATVLGAVEYKKKAKVPFNVHVVDDCLGFRHEHKHLAALKKMEEIEQGSELVLVKSHNIDWI